MRRFGGGLGLPSVRSSAAKLAIALVAGSVIAQLVLNAGGPVLYLVPAQVLGALHLWQLVTYVPLEQSPMGVLFGALIVWMTGGGLEQTWGSRRLLQFGLLVPLLAGVLTTLLALLIPALQPRVFAGGMVMSGAIWVAYGLAFGKSQLNFWGIPVSGNGFAAIGAGFVLLNAVFSHWANVVPEAIGIALAAGYVKWGSPRLLWLRLQSWRLQRQLKSRSKHLRVIAKDRNTSNDSDRYLH